MYVTTCREGRRAYVLPRLSIVIQRDGIPSWPWTAYGDDGYAICTAPTREDLLLLLGLEP